MSDKPEGWYVLWRNDATEWLRLAFCHDESMAQSHAKSMVRNSVLRCTVLAVLSAADLADLAAANERLRAECERLTTENNRLTRELGDRADPTTGEPNIGADE